MEQSEKVKVLGVLLIIGVMAVAAPGFMLSPIGIIVFLGLVFWIKDPVKKMVLE